MLRDRSGSPEKKSVSARCGFGVSAVARAMQDVERQKTHIFEITKEVGHGLTLAVGEGGLIEAIFGAI